MSQYKLTEAETESAWKCAIIGEEADKNKPEEVELQDKDGRVGGGLFGEQMNNENITDVFTLYLDLALLSKEYEDYGITKSVTATINTLEQDNTILEQEIANGKYEKSLKFATDTVISNRNRIEALQEKWNLFNIFMNQPATSIKYIRKTIKEWINGHNGIEIRDFNLIVTNFSWLKCSRKRIREMRVDDINSTVLFNGITRLATYVTPRLKASAWRCPDEDCGFTNLILQTGDEESEFRGPCIYCKREGRFTHLEDLDVHSNFIRLELEEDMSGMKRRQPERISCELMGELTNEESRLNPGDKIEVFGIYRVRKVKGGGLNRERYIEVLGMNNLGKKYDNIHITAEEEGRYLELSKNPELLNMMVTSYSPNIFGHDLEKKAMLLQIVGGNLYSKRRGEIHILLVGDPSTAKSKLVEEYMEIAPDVVRASGSPTSVVGVTACVKQDQKTGNFYLEPGAAVLADGGSLVVDEFDKMDKAVSGAMHEVMEEGKTTITKAGIVSELSAKAAVLAVMNPKNNRFIKDDSIPFKDQINLVPSLLSRFDLIFAFRDIPDRDKDIRIADAMFDARDGECIETPLEKEDITKYISFVRSKIRVMKISKEARILLRDEYVNIRPQTANPEMVAITARQLDGLCRLAEANAKLRLSSIVEIQDALVALELLKYYMDSLCKDSKGNYDYERQILGASNKEDVETRKTLEDIIKYYHSESKLNRPEGSTGPILLESETIINAFIESTGKTEKDYERELTKLIDNQVVLKQYSGRKLEYRGKEKCFE